ncbi:MAG: transporter substrate-binding domain-containing protein [Pseudomonadota bacterium]
MKIAKTLLAATAIVGISLSGAQAESHSLSIKIGTEGAYPPFNELKPDGSLVGFDVDIANALCDEMGATCEFVTSDWDGIIPGLLAGNYDAIIASMSITEERLEVVDFTNKYYNTPPAIAVPKDSDITEATDAALAGKTIGAQSSTTHSNYAEEKLSSASLTLYPTPDEYKLDIVNGRVDAVIDDVVVLSEWLETEDGACCKILGTLTPDPVINGVGAGIAIRKGEDDLKAKFNAAIDTIRANGTYDTINAKYFDFDVYGG